MTRVAAAAGAVAAATALGVARAQGDFCGWAPLCGSADGSFDWGVGDVPIPGQVLGGATVEFQDCCNLRDTTPTESCQLVNPSGESYRYLTANEPICGSNQQLCSNGQCNEYVLVIKPYFEQGSQNDGCCDSCSCYGDPQCTSFDGTYKVWVLCDGREIPDVDSMWDMCRITERRCTKELDHAGNQCQYLADDSRGRGWDVGRDGSPCVPNPKSPPSYITMYEAPSASFKFRLQQGERGIIQHVYLDLASGSFDLGAEACLTNGANAWSHTTSSLPNYFKYNEPVRGRDVVWSVVDPKSGIGINLRCHANYYDGDNGIYVARINVEDLSEPVPNRRNAAGFCETGNLDYGKATTAHTDKIVAGELCDEGLQDSDNRDIYRALCKNPALPSSGYASCIYHFCNEYFAPQFTSVDECETTTNDNLALGFCTAITYTESDVQKCMNQWDDLGAVETINQYYNDRGGCSTQIQTSLEECQSGIIIQYFRGGEWVDAVAIPDDFCGGDGTDGEIRLSYCDYPRLFNRQIRFAQKTASNACGPSNQCTTVSAFRGYIALVHDTPYPTPFPTAQPSGTPTNYPSPYPSVYPTEFPSEYPTLYPSASPSRSPVNYPTAFPTHSPVRTTPTSFPTQAPLFADSPAPCPQPTLCQTPPANVSFDDDDSFHFDMSACCPSNPCSTLTTPEQNRTQSSNKGYCQGSDSYTGEACQDSFELTVKVMFDDDDVECCKTCTCFGDPRCYTFSGDFQEFILCDGRTIPDSGSSDDRCVIRKTTCEQQTDHEGHKCLWHIPGRPGLAPNYTDPAQQKYAEEHFSITQYGSPCQYDETKSEVPTVLLYKTDGYQVVVEQGDRGYITTVLLIAQNGQYEMNADRCLAGKDWELLEGNWQFKQFTKQKYGKEIVWRVIDLFTNIELQIRCTGVLYNGAYTNTFINVEEIAEPDLARADDGDGVCATNQMPEKRLASTSHTDMLTNGGYCTAWNANVNAILQRDIVRIITNNPGVTQSGTSNAYKTFCQQYFSPGFSSVSKCVSAFLGATMVSDMITAFCTATTIETRPCEENLQVWADSAGYHDAFAMAYTQYIQSSSTLCTLKPSQLSTQLEMDSDVCQSGVELQWFNPRKNQWLPYAAFPSNSAPCTGYEVTYNYKSDPTLFKNRLRIVQRHNFMYCSGCTTVYAVDAWFMFNSGEGV